MTQTRLPPRSPAATGPSSQVTEDAALYGNKAANLMRLEKMVAEAAKVPPFFGVSTHDVMQYLGPACRQHIEALRAQLRQDWSQAGVASPAGAQQAPNATLSAATRAQLGRVRDSIVAAFVEQKALPGGNKTAAWLTQQQSFALMVRSTGREDTEAVINAGGNESVANVVATPQAVKDAMARVLASYFSEKSFQQRIMAGDDMLGEPFVPVLLQRMVGERADGQVPSSGVLFTQESEGPTQGVSQIHTTFGHNEAVVAGLVPCDTFLVDDAAIRTVIRHKPERLVPATAGGLRPAANAGELRTRPAISNQVAGRLHALGKLVSGQFGQPMDIEWTFEPESDTIYLLQARPLGQQAQRKPQHIEPAAFAAAEVLAGEVLGAAGGSVRLLRGSDQVLVANTLADALRRYLDGRQGPDGSRQADIQAIVIGEVAEATSHEATTFRSAALPVVRVADLAAARAFLARHPLLALDTARGAFAAGPSLFAAGALRADVVLDGWAKHPLPARLTRSEVRDPQAAQALLGEMVTALAAALGQPATKAPAGPMPALHALLQAAPATGAAPAIDAVPFSELLTRIDRAASPAGSAVSSAEALAWVALLRQAVRLGLLLRQTPALTARTDALVQQVMDAAARTFAARRKDVGDIQALYQTNWLRALLLQEATLDAVATDSLLGLAAEHKELAALAAAAGPAAGAERAAGPPVSPADGAAYATTATRLSKLVARPELAQAWQGYVQASMASVAGRQQFAALVVRLQNSGIAALWLNTAFAGSSAVAAMQRGARPLAAQDAAALSGTFLAELVPHGGQAGEASAFAQSMQQALTRWGAQLGQWSDPARAQALRDAFVDEVVSPLKTAGPRLYASASATQRLVLLAVLERSIDLFDQTIKQVSGSQSFAVAEKVRLFTFLLAAYGALLPVWLEVAAPDMAAQTRAVALAKKSNLDVAKESAAALQRQRDRVGQLLDAPVNDWYDEERRNNLAHTLHPSRGFDVQLAKLGTAFSSTHHAPSTAEDSFTFVHQSLLQVVASAGVPLGLGLNKLPPVLETFAQAMLGRNERLDHATHPFQSQLVSVGLSATAFSARINVPMREHGLQLELSATPGRPDEVRCKVTYSSREDEHGRLCRSRLAAYFLVAGGAGGFVAGAEPTRDVGRGVVEWTWQLPAVQPDGTSFAERLRVCLNYISATSYAPPAQERTLRTQLDTFAAFNPNIAATLQNLDEAFFLRYPWHNDEFFAYYQDQGLRDTPAFRALCTAIAQRPSEQDRMWQRRAYDVPKTAAQPKATELLQRYQAQGVPPST